MLNTFVMQVIYNVDIMRFFKQNYISTNLLSMFTYVCVPIIPGNTTREVYRLCSISSVLLEVNITELKASLMLFALCCFYHNFLKTICFLSKWLRACNFVHVRVFFHCSRHEITLQPDCKFGIT